MAAYFVSARRLVKRRGVLEFYKRRQFLGGEVPKCRIKQTPAITFTLRRAFKDTFGQHSFLHLGSLLRSKAGPCTL